MMFKLITDIEALRCKTQAAIEFAKLQKNITQIVFSILKKFDGKQVTKRIETQVKNAFPDYTIFMDDSSVSTVRLHIWGLAIPYDNRLSIFVSYNNQLGCFEYDKYIQGNGHVLSVYDQTIKNYKHGLLHIDSIVSEYNTAAKQIEVAKHNLNTYLDA